LLAVICLSITRNCTLRRTVLSCAFCLSVYRFSICHIGDPPMHSFFTVG